jgi:FlaA1/EpsC-like NDP-sugar epimerase
MISKFIRFLLLIVWPRPVLRTVALALGYSVVFALCLWAAYLLRFDFAVPSHFAENLPLVCALAVAAKLAGMVIFHQFDGLLSYFSAPDLKRVVAACVTGSLLLGGYRLFTEFPVAPPRGVILIDFVLAVAAVAATRLSFRYARLFETGTQWSDRKARRVAIVGAGESGAMLARELLEKPWLALQPVAFLDDHHSVTCSIHGIPVVGRPEQLGHIQPTLRIDELIIAMPSAPGRRVRQIVELAREASLPCRSIPSLHQLATGQLAVTSLRPVQIEDLLGRAPVQIERGEVWRVLRGRTVMVTGAGGSIGSELCRQILTFAPDVLLLVERSEPQLFAIEQELRNLVDGALIVPLIGDVSRADRMHEIMCRYQPHVLFHAAAHKHVPMMEAQPEEAIRNNIFGTVQLADLAVKHNLERFVLISTDKAVNPTSVMGATKRFAEIYIQSLSAKGTRTKFMAVRFGNVLGSSGSVVPTFTRQIAAGGPVTVTHPEMTRFFMTIPEATTLVLQSSALGKGGEIFVLDMGKPVKILDLAKQMIALSGLPLNDEIEIAFTGLRPGEKLYEELTHQRELITKTEHPKIQRLISQAPFYGEVRQALHDLTRAVNQPEFAPDALKQLLVKSIPEYTPFVSEPPALAIVQIAASESESVALREYLPLTAI